MAASKQTYTIRFLVDRDRILDAYRAYAYFRWVDDWLDQKTTARSERLAFMERQQALVSCCYIGELPNDLTPEEGIFADLIQRNPAQDSGCTPYSNMMAVMAFDADRRAAISHMSGGILALFVHRRDEALHYFIGHDDPSPQDEAHYLAVTGAHVTHMLRDTFEDVAAGYYNIPHEFLESHKIDPWDLGSDPYREWVKSRVQLARDYFKAGKGYLNQVKNLRCRIAGYAYMARFEGTLDAIEREGYRLRAEYNERKSLNAVLRIACQSSLAFSKCDWQRREMAERMVRILYFYFIEKRAATNRGDGTRTCGLLAQSGIARLQRRTV
jgi:hypothetical protein